MDTFGKHWNQASCRFLPRIQSVLPSEQDRSSLLHRSCIHFTRRDCKFPLRTGLDWGSPPGNRNQLDIFCTLLAPKSCTSQRDKQLALGCLPRSNNPLDTFYINRAKPLSKNLKRTGLAQGTPPSTQSPRYKLNIKLPVPH